jgi:hypothetical protein
MLIVRHVTASLIPARAKLEVDFGRWREVAAVEPADDGEVTICFADGGTLQARADAKLPCDLGDVPGLGDDPVWAQLRQVAARLAPFTHAR